MALGSTSSKVERNQRWEPWVLPSVADLIFIALLSLLCCSNLSLRLLGDAGIGWHIRTGQLILATHAVPRTDPFSSSMAGQPWFAWEWLYDLVVGWLDQAAGLNGVVLFTALIIALTFSWAFRLLVRKGANVLPAVVLVLLAASASMIHFLARPHVLSWLFALLFLWILESAGTRTSSAGDQPAQNLRRRWLLPPLMIAWVNLHGGFFLGLILIAIYFASALTRAWRNKAERYEDALEKIRAAREAQNLALIGLACGIATLLNPYSFHLHGHIYRYLTNRFLMAHIDEFQSPNFHLVAQKCFAALLLLTLVALCTKRHRVNATGILLIVFAVYSGLYASRNIPVSSLLLILAAGPSLSGLMNRVVPSASNFPGRMRSMELRLRGHLWPIAAAIVMTCVAAHAGKLGSTQLMAAHFDPARFPAGAINFIESNHVPGPILSTDSWGGYFIYSLYPRELVVVDDRHDFYGEAFLRSYVNFLHVEPGWEEFPDSHPAGCAVLPSKSAAASILLESPDWKPVYSDDVAIVFVRSTAKRQ